MKKLEDWQIKEIIRLYSSGEGPKVIGEKFDIAPQSVNRIIKKQGIAHNQLIRVSKENIDKIIEQYNLGISVAKISKNFNLYDTTIYKILKKNNTKK